MLALATHHTLLEVQVVPSRIAGRIYFQVDLGDAVPTLLNQHDLVHAGSYDNIAGLECAVERDPDSGHPIRVITLPS